MQQNFQADLINQWKALKEIQYHNTESYKNH